MKKDNFKIQVGDVFFAPMITYGCKIAELTILEIWLEKYFGDNKTIFLCEMKIDGQSVGRKEFFESDIINGFDNYEEAEKYMETYRKRYPRIFGKKQEG